MALVTKAGERLITQAGDALVTQTPSGGIMPLSIESLRVRVGLQPDDASKDAEINYSLQMAFEFAERYCDRKFACKENEVETFTHVEGYTVSLKRYPLISIASIQADSINSVVGFHMEPETGLIHFDNAMRSHEITVTYSGGYVPEATPECPHALPYDLLMAFLAIFDNLWSMNQAGGALPSGGVKSARIGDLSISYDTGGGDSMNEGAFGGAIPAMAASILNLYCREMT